MMFEQKISDPKIIVHDLMMSQEQLKKQIFMMLEQEILEMKLK